MIIDSNNQSLEMQVFTYIEDGILSGKYDKNCKFEANDRRSRDIYVNFHGEKLLKKLLKNPFARIIAGGCAVIVLTLICNVKNCCSAFHKAVFRVFHCLCKDCLSLRIFCKSKRKYFRYKPNYNGRDFYNGNAR